MKKLIIRCSLASLILVGSAYHIPVYAAGECEVRHTESLRWNGGNIQFCHNYYCRGGEVYKTTCVDAGDIYDFLF